MLINKFSRHMGESMITVTTASPLNIDQIKRLTAVYSAKLDHPVHINSVVDPTVLGGMRIQVATRSRTTPWSPSSSSCTAR